MQLKRYRINHLCMQLFFRSYNFKLLQLELTLVGPDEKAPAANANTCGHDIQFGNRHDGRVRETRLPSNRFEVELDSDQAAKESKKNWLFDQRASRDHRVLLPWRGGTWSG